jgi:hypothetical protein
MPKVIYELKVTVKTKAVVPTKFLFFFKKNITRVMTEYELIFHQTKQEDNNIAFDKDTYFSFYKRPNGVDDHEAWAEMYAWQKITGFSRECRIDRHKEWDTVNSELTVFLRPHAWYNECGIPTVEVDEANNKIEEIKSFLSEYNWTFIKQSKFDWFFTNEDTGKTRYEGRILKSI